MTIHFLNPGSIDQISGGYLYNKYLISELRKKDIDLQLFEVNSLEYYLELAADKADFIIIDSLLVFKSIKYLVYLIQKSRTIALVHLAPSFLHSTSEIIAKEKFVFETISSIVTSSFVKAELIKKYPNIKSIMAIPPAIEVNAVKSKYSKRIRNLITVSNVLPGKGLMELVLIMAKLSSLDWNLEIYGNTSLNAAYVKTLNDYIRKLEMQDRIRIMGSRSQNELHQLMSTKDLLIHNSEFETFGMAVHEAANIGLPFISTKVGSYLELQNHPLANFAKGPKEFRFKLNSLLNSESKFKELEINHHSKRSWSNVAEDFLKYFKTTSESS